MHILIVEDDFTSGLVMKGFLKEFGEVDLVPDGQEAVEAVRKALEARRPYDLICMDIMMPNLDGQQALRVIRSMEEDWGIYSSQGAKIVMTTAMNDVETIVSAYKGMCDGYLAKPIHKQQLIDELQRLLLIRKY